MGRHERVSVEVLLSVLPQLFAHGRHILIGRDESGGLAWKFRGDLQWAPLFNQSFIFAITARLDLLFPASKDRVGSGVMFLHDSPIDRRTLCRAIDLYADQHPRRAVDRRYSTDGTADSHFPGELCL